MPNTHIHKTKDITNEIANMTGVADYVTKADFEKRTALNEKSIVRLENRMTNLEDRMTNLEDRITNLETAVEKNAAENRESIVRLENRMTNLEDRITNLETAVGKNAIQNDKSIAHLEAIIEKHANQNRRDMLDFQIEVAKQHRFVAAMGGILVASMATVIALVGTLLLT